MLDCFCARQAQSTKLTVGARALSKHCQRALNGWWGDGNRGTIVANNNKALAALKRVLMELVWQNMHGLPHDKIIYEVRCSAGYGARWNAQIEGEQHHWEFCEFLEPQISEGHEKGWAH